MIYIVFDKQTFHNVATINTSPERIIVSDGYEVVKFDLSEAFKKKFGEYDFPDELDSLS